MITAAQKERLNYLFLKGYFVLRKEGVLLKDGHWKHSDYYWNGDSWYDSSSLSNNYTAVWLFRSMEEAAKVKNKLYEFVKIVPTEQARHTCLLSLTNNKV